MKICRFFFCSKVVSTKQKCENRDLTVAVCDLTVMVCDLTIAVRDLSVVTRDISITKYKKIKQFYIFTNFIR